MTGPPTDDADHEFARRAAAYLREQGLTEDEITSALVAELGLRSPEAAQAAATSDAA